MVAVTFEARAATGTAPRALELAVIVPTFNEAANAAELIRRLDSALAGLAWDVVVVDSPDGTAEIVHCLTLTDPHIRVIRRIGPRGLSTAVIEGMLASAAPALAAIDGDMQTDRKFKPP